MFENFKFHIFIKYFLLLVGFLLIPFMALGLLLTNYVMSQYKNEIYDMAQNSVDYICSTVENELEDIYEIKVLVGQDDGIKNFISYPAGERRGDKVYEAYEVSKIMESYCAYRDIVTEIHLYSELRDTVVVPNGIYTRKEYYDAFLTDSGWTYEQWCGAIEANDETISPLIYNATIQNQRKNIAMVNFLYHSGIRDSAMFAVLDMNKILDIYEQVTKEMPEMYFAVMSGEQIVIVSNKMPEELDIQKIIDCDSGEQLCDGFVAFKSISADGGLSYICLASEEVILEKFVKVEAFLKGVIIILILGMVFLAFLFSNKTFGPVKEMLLLYSPENTYKMSGLNELQDLFINVFNSNMKLRDVVSNQEKCINNNMFRMLLQNSIDLDEYALQVLFEAMPVSQDARYFRVMIVALNGRQERTEESLNFKILSAFHGKCEEAGLKYCVIPNEGNKNIFLFTYEERDIKIKVVLEELMQELEQSENIDVHITLGREIESLQDFSKSYEAAVFALRRCRAGVMCYDGGQDSFADNLDFLDKEKLISYILAGNKERLVIFFDMLYSEMFGEYLLTHRIQNYIRYFLCDVIREALGNKISHNQKLAKMVDKCVSTLELSDYEDSFQIIKQSFFDAADEMAAQSTVKKKNFEDVIQYIHENYALYDLSLKLIAEEMDISYKYLSDVFKKETGKTFLEYVHDIRDKKAKELLATTEISITDIGEQVGYLSSNTFIKTFKKLNGITPGEFRKNYRGEI